MNTNYEADYQQAAPTGDYPEYEYPYSNQGKNDYGGGYQESFDGQQYGTVQNTVQTRFVQAPMQMQMVQPQQVMMVQPQAAIQQVGMQVVQQPVQQVQMVPVQRQVQQVQYVPVQRMRMVQVQQPVQRQVTQVVEFQKRPVRTYYEAAGQPFAIGQAKVDYNAAQMQYAQQGFVSQQTYPAGQAFTQQAYSQTYPGFQQASFQQANFQQPSFPQAAAYSQQQVGFGNAQPQGFGNLPYSFPGQGAPQPPAPVPSANYPSYSQPSYPAYPDNNSMPSNYDTIPGYPTSNSPPSNYPLNIPHYPQQNFAREA